ncbi:hypothetical protein HJC23_007914 [Cyclotella cryptica]|uniref:Uncharacterized protein n=1 Tax=Cyclotella cryptica TaxID=29204 RepID=A0ABD3NZ99_9STRA|eukprot:CCRYP_018784-RA/>CCRYP_018784-RA protein AED:0.37 eAED:0.37 QI:0/-1/0/1/-1/1/1/0/463
MKTFLVSRKATLNSHQDGDPSATSAVVDEETHSASSCVQETKINHIPRGENSFDARTHSECMNNNIPDEISKGRRSADYSEMYAHDLMEGDHVVRWIMLGFCYPVQVHGIVLSVGPDLVTIVDCGLTSVAVADQVGALNEQGKINSRYTKTRRRMNVLTLVDENEIKKWKRVRYGEECELRVHSTYRKPHVDDDAQVIADEQQNSSGDLKPYLEYEEQQSITQIDLKQDDQSGSFWSSKNDTCDDLLVPNPDPSQKSENNEISIATLKLEANNNSKKTSDNSHRFPKSDPTALVLARLRFLLEYGEGDSVCNNNNETDKSRQPILPPHHILFANSECIAVWIKTGHWSTLQASVFLHSSTVGNAKQTATLAMYLSAQTVTVPAAGIWGFFGGTTTVSLFSTQPWLVPALVCGGVVYVGMPAIVLWRAKKRWAETEKRLNVAFWEHVDSAVIVELIEKWSGLDG